MEEITAEYAVQELAPSAELHIRPKVSVACKSDLGRVRENNEDKFEYYIPSEDSVLATRGQIYLVCDGMGGHAAGQIASELTCKTFIEVYLHHPAEDAETAAYSAVVAANRFVLDVARAVPSRRGMGTTLSALLIVQDRALTVQVGDSRIYRLRNDMLEMLTTDHTWVEDAISQGMITEEEASAHPYRHVLTRAVGTEDSVQPDLAWRNVEIGDTYLLCSDGLLNHVPDPEIAEILMANAPSEAAWKLVGQALAGGGSDNCTVLIVHIDDLEPVVKE